MRDKIKLVELGLERRQVAGFCAGDVSAKRFISTGRDAKCLTQALAVCKFARSQAQIAEEGLW